MENTSCCIYTFSPYIFLNAYGGLHGGAVAAVAEMVSIACARTVVSKDKDLFLGELSMSYLFAAPRNAEVIVDASVVRSGRNVTAVTIFGGCRSLEQLAFVFPTTYGGFGF
ncbi:unnamed protein product [Ilex paraguariensis]|uniref:Thioesterase domain-containing protein n=1 Tax=Ilex paraguariensis TaxID=185542 RepID=A0ABC8UGD7_9AQUA